MDRIFTTPFGDAGGYVRVGDHISAAHGPVRFRAGILRDCDTQPPDQRDDGFWPSRDPGAAGYCPPEIYDDSLRHARRAMDTWKRDLWWYGGVYVQATMADSRVPALGSAELWGVEVNYLGEPEAYNAEGANPYLLEVANELVPEALDRLRVELVEVVFRHPRFADQLLKLAEAFPGN